VLLEDMSDAGSDMGCDAAAPAATKCAAHNQQRGKDLAAPLLQLLLLLPLQLL